jgi:hypothetical protein
MGWPLESSLPTIDWRLEDSQKGTQRRDTARGRLKQPEDRLTQAARR